MHHTLQALASVASSNDGVLSREAAVIAGASSQQLHRWIKAGRLEAIGHNAIVFPGGIATFRRQLRSALINAGSDAVASHRSAAYLHGFDGFAEVDPEVLVFRAQRGRQGLPGVLRSTSRLSRADRTVIDTFSCTTAARTIIDLSGCCERNDLENAIDSAVRNGQMSVDYLRRRLGALRHCGRDGAILLDELLIDSGGTNLLERRFLRLCRQGGLPRPECQVVVRNGSQRIGRVDFEFQHVGLVVEVEGQIGHSSPRQRQNDARRRRQLAETGRELIVFTYQDVFERPEQTTADLAAAFARIRGI